MIKDKNIENFTLIEFATKPKELIEEYLIALRYVPARKTKKQLFHMKLKHVEMIKQNINSSEDVDLIKIVAKVQEVKKENIYKLKIIEFFGLLNSIRDQLKQIIEAETTGLTSENIDYKWEMVEGSQRMSKFGIYNTLENLSGGDILKYKEIKNLKYSEVFMVLLMKKTASDIRADMAKIKDHK